MNTLKRLVTGSFAGISLLSLLITYMQLFASFFLLPVYDLLAARFNLLNHPFLSFLSLCFRFDPTCKKHPVAKCFPPCNTYPLPLILRISLFFVCDTPTHNAFHEKNTCPRRVVHLSFLYSMQTCYRCSQQFVYQSLSCSLVSEFKCQKIELSWKI